MNNNCDVIRDLLALYIDDVCSDSSRRLVEEHLPACAECTELLQKMRETNIEDSLGYEKNAAIVNQARTLKRKGVIAGSIIGGILMIPVLVCLIVNLATGHALSWFFIVLASLALFASLTVVPLMAPDNKFLWMAGSFTASLVALLAVCCIYSHGRWFFVAASAVLFGLAVVLLPFVAKCRPVRERLKNNRGLFVLGADTLLFALMMLAIGTRNGMSVGLVSTAAALLPVIALIWGIWAICRYTPWGGTAKAGMCVALSGAFVFFYEYIANLILGVKTSLPQFGAFSAFGATDGSIKWTILVSCTVLGAVLTLVGALSHKKEN